MLVSFSSKIGRRQAQIEREYLARQNAGLTTSQPEDFHPPATLGRIISINPLLLVLCLIVVLAWCFLWMQRSKFWTKGPPPLTSDAARSRANHSLEESV